MKHLLKNNSYSYTYILKHLYSFQDIKLLYVGYSMLGLLNNLLSPNKNLVGFEDIKYIIHNSSNTLLINTLSNTEQTCLIYGTISYDKEETVINEKLDKLETNIIIVIYGKNSCDESINKKYKQLSTLGFKKVYIYAGGLFEWLLLQDIYGSTEFPTTTVCKDLLYYRQPCQITL